MGIKSNTKSILAFQKEREWKQFHLPKNLAISLSVEAGEVLEIFQWTKNNGLPIGKKRELALELADVYYYLLLLAHETNIDINKAFKEKTLINRKKYPIHKAKGTSKKYTEL